MMRCRIDNRFRLLSLRGGPQQKSFGSNGSSTRTGKTRHSPGVDLEHIAAQHRVRLTPKEQDCLRQQLDRNKDGLVSVAELQTAGKQALEQTWTRELLLGAIEKPTTAGERLGLQRVLQCLDYGGTALFAVVGTQLAGEKGMNLIGCTLVGCIAANGGGTLNNLLYGSSPILNQPGVFWVRTPLYLIVSLVASIATFYSWPLYCRYVAKQELEQFIGTANLNRDGSVDKQAFVEACCNNREFANSVAIAYGLNPMLATPSELFAAADMDQTGKISLTEMETLVAKQFDASPIMYALDTAALSAFASVAVHGAVKRGLHPVVAASSGVTICFGKTRICIVCF